MYFANPTGAAVNYMKQHVLGYIDTPLQGNRRPDDVVWCADNGCFNDKTFNEQRWWNWLEANAHAAATCRFATAPDVVGDHHATLTRSLPWLPKIRALGYPAAFVAQDGATVDTLPCWDDFDCLFLGGTTEFKLGQTVRELAAEAHRQGKWVHGGRCNSKRRFRYMADELGCHSADGTYLVFAPDTNLPKLLSWIDDYNTQPALFGGTQ
jgi:hypothetical protein